MGSLFFNKVAAALLAVGLVILGLITLGDSLFHTEQPEEFGYPVDLTALEAGSGGGEAEEEGPTDFGLLLASADLTAGERVARRCASCHTFDEGGADGTGPHLWDVMGRAVGAVAGFNYSGAMEEYAQGGAVAWGFQNMYDYLESPRRYVPGTAMSFAGLRNQEDRINLIAYMRSLSNAPIDLPEPLAAEPVMQDGEGQPDAGEMFETGAMEGADAEAVTEATEAGEEADVVAEEGDAAPADDTTGEDG